jgi:hypothetical protein
MLVWTKRIVNCWLPSCCCSHPSVSFIQSIHVLPNAGRQGSWTFATTPSWPFVLMLVPCTQPGSACFVRKPEDLNLTLSRLRTPARTWSAGRGVWLAPEIAVPGRLDALSYQRLDAIERRFEVSGNRFTSTRHSSLLPSPATTNPDPPSHSRRLPLRDRAAGLPSAVAHQPRSRPPMRAARLSIRVSA